MPKVLGKEIFTILGLKILFILTYAQTHSLTGLAHTMAILPVDLMALILCELSII